MKSFLDSVVNFIFDMDGVITNTMPYHFLAWKEAFKSIGLKVDKFDIYSREGQTGTKALKEIFDIYKKEYNIKTAKRLLFKKEEFFKKIVKRRYILGSRSFIKHLLKKHYNLGLVTGTSRDELLRILPENFVSIFSAVITSSEVKNGKPHPEPYLKALHLMKSNPSESIVIENAPLGIRSAKSAGIKCFALETSLERKYLFEADRVFSSFKELETYLGI